MRILNEGDKSQAVCSHCKKLMNTTYRLGYYRALDRDRVLLGYCDGCGELISIPAQSAETLTIRGLGLDDHGE